MENIGTGFKGRTIKMQFVLTARNNMIVEIFQARYGTLTKAKTLNRIISIYARNNKKLFPDGMLPEEEK